MIPFLTNRFLFFPSTTVTLYPSQLDLSHEEVRLQSEPGIMLQGWFFLGNRPDRTVLYLHGNAGNIGDRLEKILFLKKIGWNIFIFDYRGYGGSLGRPTVAGVLKDAEAAYRWLTSGRGEKFSPEKIILFGESLGGALAVDLASREPVGAVILEGTFTSIRAMAKHLYPFLPTALVPNIFRSAERIRKLHVPLLVIHGTDDETVPFFMGKELYAKAPHPKRCYEIQGAHHKDAYLFGKEEYLRQVEEFLNEAGL